ncbi:hypothetical protein GDO78_004426 [Eleutherodactylus coqui]|uniref:Granulocyte colony-stimulating factor n=1 Tax=Eleutherodactylus coqui TaxID=57060 RepID=A0A8J6ESM1_ELECQ|nr:hypothetical protein GDO78_004426 [Eleutherodactylus coqui]
MGSNEELLAKIKMQAGDIKDAMQLKEENLSAMRAILRISPMPLEQCQSGSFNQDACYTQLVNSLKTAESLLSSAHQYTATGLTDLLLDLQELISNFEETMMEKGIPVPATSPQTLRSDISEFQEKAGIFLILHDLCKSLTAFQEGLAAQSVM